MVQFIGLGAAILAIVLVFLFRWMDNERNIQQIENGITLFNQNAQKHLENSEKLLQDLHAFKGSQDLKPDITTYVATQWEFFEKTFHNRQQKQAICRHIAGHRISSGTSVLLDSGSSIDLVTLELLKQRFTNVHVFSNNIFAAIHLVGLQDITLHVMEGIFSHRFAATYSTAANNKVEGLGINVFVLATTALRFETGIMVHKDDTQNRDFKIAALNAFKQSREGQLVIAADGSKFSEPLADHEAVLDTEDWRQMLRDFNDRIFLVTSVISDKEGAENVSQFQREVEQFRNEHVDVHIC